MSRLFGGLIILLALCAPARADLPRIVSLNLCADAYLMAFAERSQILALTAFSRNPDLSAFAEEAQNFPVSDGRIETIVGLRPDLVIVSPYSDPLRNRLLAEQGVKIFVLDAAADYAAARAEITRLGTAIERPTQAAAYRARLDTALAASRNDTGARILPVQRRGLTIGDTHILADIIRHAGAHLIGDFKGHMRAVGLEAVIASKADYILLSEADPHARDRGLSLIHI